MKVQITPAIDELCRKAAHDAAELPEGVRMLARSAVGQAAVEWDALKQVAAAVAQQCTTEAERPQLHQLCRGGGVVLPPPPRRAPGKSPELQAHLDRMRLRLEQQQYDAMVADVTVTERRAAEASEGGMRSYRKQISFGVHVLVMMGTFYAFGHVAGTAFTSNRIYHPVFGLGFMVFAMLLETVLFVIRTTVPPRLHHEVEERGRRQRARRAAELASQATGGAPAAALTAADVSRKKDA